MGKKKILNIAHRGFTRTFPENTLNAFEDAIRMGVDCIECDVRETSDHSFVICHDEILMGRKIAHMSLSEIKNIQYKDNFKIPTLQDVLELCKNRVKLLLDVKSLVSLNEFFALITFSFSRNDLMIASFNPLLILKMAYLNSDINKGIIIESIVAKPALLLKKTSANFLVAAYPVLYKELVKEIHDMGYEIFVWNLPDERSIRDALSLKVDGIISHQPDLVSQIISELSPTKQNYNC